MMRIKKEDLLTAKQAVHNFETSVFPADHPLSKAWAERDMPYYPDSNESPIDRLLEAAVFYGIQWANATSSEKFHDGYNIEFPSEYLTECKCHDWAAPVRNHVFQHKPSCPKFVMEYELALMAEKEYKRLMDQIQAHRNRSEAG